MVPSSRSSSPAPAEGFVTTWRSIPTGAQRRYDLKWLLQLIIKCIVWAYLRAFHDFQFRYHPGLPRGCPHICVISHTSVLDVPALMVVNPYEPPTCMIIKKEAVQVPGLNWILRLWDAIPVARQGQDIAALRQIKKRFSEGRGICVAPAGTRSPDGRLGPVNPVLARLIAQNDVAVFPAVIVGSMECLPTGSKFPRRGKIYVDTGPEIDLRRFRGRRLSDQELVEVARLIRDSIADLLPEYMKPDPTTPVLGTYVPGK